MPFEPYIWRYLRLDNSVASGLLVFPANAADARDVRGARYYQEMSPNARQHHEKVMGGRLWKSRELLKSRWPRSLAR